MNPWLLALLLWFTLKLGVLVVYLLWRAEHPNTKFVAWVHCILGDGHFAGTRERNGWHRCQFCNDPIHPEDMGSVQPDRVRFSRKNHTTTKNTWA